MPRRKTVTDEEVLDRALPLIARKGPTGFTLADVAEEVDLAPATLIQRFGDKRTLIRRAFTRDNERFARWVRALPDEPGKEAVLAIYDEMMALYGEVSEELGEPEGIADQLLWLREDVRDPVLNRLTRERATLFCAAIVARLPPLPIPADDAARLLDAQFHGAVVQWALEPEGTAAEYVMASLRSWFRLAGE